MGQADIAWIRELIRALNYVVTRHATEELDDDNLTILDLESIAFTGEIVASQRDRKTREVKYLIRGKTVVKVGPIGTLVVITIYVV